MPSAFLWRRIFGMLNWQCFFIVIGFTSQFRCFILVHFMRSIAPQFLRSILTWTGIKFVCTWQASLNKIDIFSWHIEGIASGII